MPKTFRVSFQKCVINSFSCVSVANLCCGRCESFNLNCSHPKHFALLSHLFVTHPVYEALKDFARHVLL